MAATPTAVDLTYDPVSIVRRPPSAPPLQTSPRSSFHLNFAVRPVWRDNIVKLVGVFHRVRVRILGPAFAHLAASFSLNNKSRFDAFS
jgi:hypothetical protein